MKTKVKTERDSLTIVRQYQKNGAAFFLLKCQKYDRKCNDPFVYVRMFDNLSPIKRSQRKKQ